MIATTPKALPRAAMFPVKSVLVFRALKLGDMLCAVPALRALRRGLPRAKIILLGLPWARTFAARFHHYIDDFMEFPGYPGLPEQKYEPGNLARFMKRTLMHHFDLAIQMHGSGMISNRLVASLGARFTAGYYPAGQARPDRDRYIPYPEKGNEVERNLALVRHLGFIDQGTNLEFPLLDEDAAELSAAEKLRGLTSRTYVCIHPGASVREKCWPVDHFARIGLLLRQKNLTVVATGNRREADLAARISGVMGGDCIDAASLDLSLGSLALLIRDARLLVCNDTGISHIASALGVPSVVIFTLADPDRWAPLDRTRHRALGGKGRSPSAEEVMNEVSMLLSEPGGT
jgi:hypothetical protein